MPQLRESFDSSSMAGNWDRLLFSFSEYFKLEGGEHYTEHGDFEVCQTIQRLDPLFPSYQSQQEYLWGVLVKNFLLIIFRLNLGTFLML